jgi:hypothetical protein
MHILKSQSRFARKLLQADLNGDGKPELLIATPAPGAQLQLIAPRQPGDGFAPALVLHEVALSAVLGRSQVQETPAVAAMSAGYLSPAPKDLVRTPRKQVVAVITTDGEAVLLDHNLRLLWRQKVSLQAISPEGRRGFYNEAAVLITSHAAVKGDRGMVIVGTRPKMRPLSLSDDDDIFDGNPDVAALEHELAMEAEGRTRAHGRGAADELHEIEMSQHFSYIAFAGGTGEVRWRHRGDSFHPEVAALHDSMVATQHGLHAAAQLEEGPHYGEASCRDYREAVLAALPHAWASPHDTQLHLAHFHRHRAHSGEQKAHLASMAANRHLNDAPSGPVQASQLNGQHHHKPPNVVVAHTKEGLEAIHLYSGRTVCRLSLTPDALHVDLNGDGVPDHVRAVGGTPYNLAEEAAEEDADRSMRHAKINFCSALVTSGIPPRQRLFNGTICRPLHGKLQRMRNLGPLQVAMPAALPLAGRVGRYSSKMSLRQKLAAIFLTSDGDLTSYSSDGELLWQTFTGISWRGRGSGKTGATEEEEEFIWEGGEVKDSSPTLLALPLRKHAAPSAVVAGGEAFAMVVSEHGGEIAWLELPEPPAQPLLALDFNLDGYLDLVEVGGSGVYGWAQVRRPGAVSFSALIGGLIVTMLAVFVMQQGLLLQPGNKMKGRSTDRVD